MDKAVRNVHEWTDLDIAKVVAMATANPAKLLGIYPQKGVLKEGADADIAIFNNDLFCQSTYVGGKKVYQR